MLLWNVWLVADLTPYNVIPNSYCAFPEDDDGIQMYFQDVTRYEDLGNVTRACNKMTLDYDDGNSDTDCNRFYFSEKQGAYFICPAGSELREKKGYLVFYNSAEWTVQRKENKKIVGMERDYD